MALSVLRGAAELRTADSARLPDAQPHSTLKVTPNGQMDSYAWGIKGKKVRRRHPLVVTRGQRLRMHVVNDTMMLHPMHIHGHTWALPGSAGLRKDTVLIKPMASVELDLDADNPRH